MYVSDLDQTMTDVDKNPLVSLSVSQAMYDPDGPWDPEDPRCARLTLTGTLVNFVCN